VGEEESADQALSIKERRFDILRRCNRSRLVFARRV